jgi:imidazolonepropionase-like amidohydrolase
MAAPEDYHFIEVSKAAKALADRRVSVLMGAHGQLHGLAAHWETWMLQMGGMTSLEALRAATIQGAAYLGLDRDIGSVATGKLADLVVLDANPLENIRNTTSVRYVLINGRIYDAATMAEAGNHPTPAPRPVWRESGISETTMIAH